MAIYLGDKLASINNVLNNSSVVAQPLLISTNGTYTAPTGAAYSPVTVNVDPNDTLKPGVLRSDAGLIQTYTYDSFIVANEQVTFPAYATSSTSIRASQNLTPTIQIDYNNYNYYILMRMLAIPSYNTNTPAKGRNEYQFSVYQFELTAVPVSLTSLVGNKTYTNSNSAVFHSLGLSRMLYWSSATALGMYTATTYGILELPTTPTINSSGVMTVKSPYINFRGHATYLPQDQYEAITDIRMQYVIDVYRAPKNHLNIDGWGAQQELLKCLNCINNNNFVLT